MSLRARALDHFVEPRTVPERRAARGEYLTPVAPRAPRGRVAATRLPLRAAVLGSAGGAVPVGALLANALRSAVGAHAAALAVWAPGVSAARGEPSTPAASRLAARMAARGLPAVARGRLAWMALDEHPVAAVVATRRAAGALELPFVVVLAGPRCDAVEGVLAEQDLVVIAAADPEGPLARLAVAGCAGAALACAPPAPGVARWVARSGAAGHRGLGTPLRSLVRELARVPEPDRLEALW